MKRKITDELLQHVYKKLCEGIFLRDIAKDVNISCACLSQKLTRNFDEEYTKLSRENVGRGFRRYLEEKTRKRKQLHAKLAVKIRYFYLVKRHSLSEISHMCNLSPELVRKIMVEHNIPRRGFGWHKVKRINNQPPFLTIDKTKLLALLLGDGTEEKSTYKIIFVNKDEVLRAKFMQLMLQEYGKNIKFYFRKLQMQVNSIEILNDLHKYVPTLMKRHDGKETNTHVPAEIINGKPEMRKAFLRYFFSCDGYATVSPCYRKDEGKWYIQRRVGLKCKHGRLRSQCRELLESLGIKSSENNNGLQIDTYSEVEKFAKTIGFVDGSKIHNDSKYWKGKEKNAILRLAVKYPTKHSFNSKEECITSIREFDTSEG